LKNKTCHKRSTCLEDVQNGSHAITDLVQGQCHTNKSTLKWLCKK